MISGSSARRRHSRRGASTDRRLDGVTTRTVSCRFCGAPLTCGACDLGAQPPGQPVRSRRGVDAPEPRFTLRLTVCARCLLVQLEHTVDPALLFGGYPLPVVGFRDPARTCRPLCSHGGVYTVRPDARMLIAQRAVARSGGTATQPTRDAPHGVSTTPAGQACGHLGIPVSWIAEFIAVSGLEDGWTRGTVLMGRQGFRARKNPVA